MTNPVSISSRLGTSVVLMLAFFLLLAQSLRSQVVVDLAIKGVIYVAYEPLLATVTIKNLSGNRLLLADVEGKKWFGFQIETLDGRPIPPSDPNYQIEPIQIGPGEMISRTINLIQLYPMGDFGSYRIRANVYVPELQSYFSSPPLTVEITEGRLIWEQTVGVPGNEGTTGRSRTISLLSHRLTDKTNLYLRIEDKASGIVYCTHRLGDFISWGAPEVMLDADNNVYVLHNSIPHEFVFSKVSLNGKILDRISYSAPKNRPQLKHLPDGGVAVVGGIPFDPHATPTPALIPKLSERPVPLPTPEALASPKHNGKAQPPPKTTPGPKVPKGTRPSPSPSPIRID